MSNDKMQGEGDKESAQNYRDDVEDFIKSDKVKEKAEEAVNSSEKEKEEMEEAEEKGKEKSRA